jgi:hypothetical protein
MEALEMGWLTKMVSTMRTSEVVLDGYVDRCYRCVISNVLVVIGTTLAVAFNALLACSWMRTAGVLEWALTYSGGFWLLTFVGYLK